MILIYKITNPIDTVAQRIVNSLNKITGVKATSDFQLVIPRGYNITIEIPDESTHQDVLEIGGLIGMLDKY